MEFQDRVALVTGAASGIGLTTSRMLAERGAQVVMIDIDEKRVTVEAGAIRRGGGKAEARVLDIRDYGITGSLAADYSAAKSGMVGFTRSLALIGAPHGVRACCVSPGPVLTPGSAKEIVFRNRRPSSSTAGGGKIASRLRATITMDDCAGANHVLPLRPGPLAHLSPLPPIHETRTPLPYPPCHG